MLDPKVSVIFVNYKTPKMTADAINSVKEKTKDVTYEIIVVDNSCDKNEYNELVNEINDANIKIIDAKENLGFGKANNLGSTYAKGEYLFFLNTDTLLLNDAISILANYLDSNSNVGIVGGNLYTKNMKPHHSFYNKVVDFKSDKKEQKIFSIILKLIINKNKYEFNFTGLPKRIKGYICGADLMIRKNTFLKINGFEKDIFMYAEDTMLCYRVITDLNMDIYNIPSAKIIHYEGKSFTHFSEFKGKIYIEAKYTYYTKIFGLDMAKKYLHTMYKLFKRKANFFKLFNVNEKYQQYKHLLNAVDNKLKEIGEIK